MCEAMRLWALLWPTDNKLIRLKTDFEQEFSDCIPGHSTQNMTNRIFLQ